jgi:hypothetical protein
LSYDITPLLEPSEASLPLGTTDLDYAVSEALLLEPASSVTYRKNCSYEIITFHKKYNLIKKAIHLREYIQFHSTITTGIPNNFDFVNFTLRCSHTIFF